MYEIDSNIESLNLTLNDLSATRDQQDELRSRIQSFRSTLEKQPILDKFDRLVFESIVEKAIIGGYNENGQLDPGLITFIFKTGFKEKLHKSKFKVLRREFDSDGNQIVPCTFSQNEDVSMSSFSNSNTYRDYDRTTTNSTSNLVEILRFKHFTQKIYFTPDGNNFRNKVINNHVMVRVVLDLGCGYTSLEADSVTKGPAQTGTDKETTTTF
mgnify:CR=1 FL=1